MRVIRNRIGMYFMESRDLFLLPSSLFPLPSSLFLLNDCEEWVKILVSSCKTLNRSEDMKDIKDA